MSSAVQGLDQNIAAALRERDPLLFPKGNPAGAHFMLPRAGCPGTVTLFGPFAIPLVVVSTGGDGADAPHKAIAAASCMGRGRVVAIAHEGYLSSNDPAMAAFVNLCIAWVGGAQRTLKVTKESEVEQARAHIEQGGGCIVASCPWGWNQLNPTRKLSDYALNSLLAPAGLCFSGDCAPGSGPIRVGITRECTSALLSSMLSANFVPRTTLAHLALSLDPSKQVAQAHISYPPNSDHLVGTFPPNDQVNARAAYGVGGWWAPVCDCPALEFNFQSPREISGVEAFCVNVEACPKEISLFASRDGKAWDLLARFPFPTYNGPDGKTNTPQKFLLQNAVSVQFFKVQFNGIHKSHYIGINSVTFLNTSLVVPPTGSSISASALEAMPPAYRQIIAKDLLASLNVGFTAPTAKEAVARDSSNGASCMIMSTVSKHIQIALPRAADFPGACAATVNPVASGRAASNFQLPVRALGYEGGWWYSTRRYADPNSLITITPLMLPHPNGATDYTVSWQLRIGCHSDNLEGCERFSRWPDVCDVIDLPRVGGTITVYPRFGGLIYLQAKTTVPAHHAVFNIDLQGTWSAPYYSKATGFQPGDAPWGEVEGEKVILSLPSHAIQDAESRGDLPSAASYWDAVVTHHHQLATPPYGARKERIVPDVQISCGYMHSGYPIMCHLDFAERALDVMKMMSEGDWGMFHELGHNMQRDWWTWDHTTEVTVNLFTLYSMKHFLGRDLQAFDNLWGREGRDKVMKWVREGKSRQQWNDDAFLALYMYAQLINAFGWEALREVLRRYERNDTLRPAHGASGDAKMQRWAEIYSSVVGRNLAPFFSDWGFPVRALGEQATMQPWQCDIPT